jgi:hypothetical protein
VDGKSLPSGEYTWRALFHGKLALSLRGRIGDFGGDRGSPSAAAADGSQVYLGWSLASAGGDAVVACTPAGTVRWRYNREPLSGCRALAVDAGLVYVLGGEGPDAEGRAIYRLSAKDGSLVPWPDGRTDLKIVSLWPANGKYKPDLAEYMAVKNGRIYVSFSIGQFIAVLDGKTGKYLQTIVGAPPGPLDAVATKSDDPANPGQLVDADFLAVTLRGASIGKLLLAHNPIWVLASDLTPLDGIDRITALTAMGDNATHHPREIFVGLSSPLNQVQARPALDTENVSFEAGKEGGRAPVGPWAADKLADIRGLALDATGQLWVAEGDSIPRRISVWTTDGALGALVREYFAPPDPGSPVAIDPLDPTVIYAGGCEWRIGPGKTECLGVVTREPMRAARFATQDNHLLLGLTTLAGAEQVFERVSDGDYRKGAEPAPPASAPRFALLPTLFGSLRLTTADGYDLGTLFDQEFTTKPHPSAGEFDLRPELAAGTTSPFRRPPTEAVPSQTRDGRVFIAARFGAIWIFELTGVDTIRPLASGRITLPR